MLLDFFKDKDGHVANAFYKIDDEGNLIKLENGIRKIKDRSEIEKAFK